MMNSDYEEQAPLGARPTSAAQAFIHQLEMITCASIYYLQQCPIFLYVCVCGWGARCFRSDGNERLHLYLSLYFRLSPSPSPPCISDRPSHSAIQGHFNDIIIESYLS